MYVRLHCNTSLETPVLTTEGDSGHPLFYVRRVLPDMLDILSSALICTQVFDLYSQCACPGECVDQALSMGALAGIIIGSV